MKTLEKYMLVANEFKDRVLQYYGDEVEEIILFGSLARGEVKKDSDIDILVVLKNRDISLMKEICGIAFEISLKYKVDISPKIYSHREISKCIEIGTPFIEGVLRDEVPLYGTLRFVKSTA